MSSTQDQQCPEEVKQGQPQDFTNVALHNQLSTPAPAVFEKSYTWYGKVIENIPTAIPSNSVEKFTQFKTMQGCCAMVMYTMPNLTGCGLDAILLAWEAPSLYHPPKFTNKVFVLCGPKHIVESMTPDDIKLRLDHSKSISSCNDMAAKIGVDATIVPLHPDGASVIAKFHRFL